MKIVMPILRFRPAIGGGEEHVYQLSRKLIEKGHKVTIFTSNLKTHYPKPTYLVKEPSQENYDALFVKRFRALCMTSEYPILLGLTKGLLEEDFDIIHAHGYGYFTSDCSALVSLIYKKPLILTTHGFFPASTPVNPLLKTAYTALSRYWLLKRASKLICVSRADAAYYREQTDPSKIVVVPNGIDVDYWSKLPKHLKFQAKFETKGPMLVSVGRITQVKGYQYLIRSMPNILKEFSDAMYFIVGPDAGYVNNLKKLAHELKVEGHVVFTGPLMGEKKKKVYADADVVIIPSTDEAFGIVALEAMACRKPVVATNVGGLSEVIKHGVNGILTKPRNSSELTRAVLTILKNPTLAAQMGHRNRKEVERYSWNKIVKLVAKVYSEALR